MNIQTLIKIIPKDADGEVIVHIYYKKGDDTIFGPLVRDKIEIEIKDGDLIISVADW